MKIFLSWCPIGPIKIYSKFESPGAGGSNWPPRGPNPKFRKNHLNFSKFLLATSEFLLRQPQRPSTRPENLVSIGWLVFEILTINRLDTVKCEVPILHIPNIRNFELTDTIFHSYGRACYFIQDLWWCWVNFHPSWFYGVPNTPLHLDFFRIFKQTSWKLSEYNFFHFSIFHRAGSALSNKKIEKGGLCVRLAATSSQSRYKMSEKSQFCTIRQLSALISPRLEKIQRKYLHILCRVLSAM